MGEGVLDNATSSAVVHVSSMRRMHTVSYDDCMKDESNSSSSLHLRSSTRTYASDYGGRSNLFLRMCKAISYAHVQSVPWIMLHQLAFPCRSRVPMPCIYILVYQIPQMRWFS